MEDRTVTVVEGGQVRGLEEPTRTEAQPVTVATVPGSGWGRRRPGATRRDRGQTGPCPEPRPLTVETPRHGVRKHVFLCNPSVLLVSENPPLRSGPR